MDRGERQEINNTKGTCFCLRVRVCIKQDKKGVTGLHLRFYLSLLHFVAESLKNTKERHFKFAEKYGTPNQPELVPTCYHNVFF